MEKTIPTPEQVDAILMRWIEEDKKERSPYVVKIPKEHMMSFCLWNDYKLSHVDFRRLCGESKNVYSQRMLQQVWFELWNYTRTGLSCDAIYPMKPSPTLLAILNSDNPYRLTGSRRFGIDTRGSDWDFYILKSDEVIAELEELGFSHDMTEKTNHYLENVYAHPTENIHIQVMETESMLESKDKVHYAIFLAACGSVRKNEEFKKLFSGTKEQKKLMWKVFVQAYSLGKEKGVEAIGDNIVYRRAIDIFGDIATSQIEGSPAKDDMVQQVLNRANREYYAVLLGRTPDTFCDAEFVSRSEEHINGWLKELRKK